MVYAHDTEVALLSVAQLVNTWVTQLREGWDPLAERSGLERFLRDQPFSGRIDGGQDELEQVRGLRPRLHGFWTADGPDEAVELVNAVLRETAARPYLVKHDGWDWHLHVTEPDQPLAVRISAEAAMAVSELIRADDLDRLRICGAGDCVAVLVDLSRNRSKRFCDTGNCGNRMNVAAYRARKAASTTS